MVSVVEKWLLSMKNDYKQLFSLSNDYFYSFR